MNLINQLRHYAWALNASVWEPVSSPREFLDEVRKLKQRSGTLFFIGNGASATIASHMALDWEKRTGVQTRCFNDAASLTAYANDHGYEEVFSLPLRKNAVPGDILVAISSSGRSPNILKAVQEARAQQMLVVTLSGFKENNPLRKSGDFNFHTPVEKYGQVEVAHTAILHCLLDEMEKA